MDDNWLGFHIAFWIALAMAVIIVAITGFTRVGETGKCVALGYAGSENWKGNIACVRYNESGEFVVMPIERLVE